jgi:hypothetical protein
MKGSHSTGTDALVIDYSDHPDQLVFIHAKIDDHVQAHPHPSCSGFVS